MELLNFLHSASLADLFMIAGTLLSLASVWITARSLKAKMNAQRDLIALLSSDEDFVRNLIKFDVDKKIDNGAELRAQEIEVLQKLIAERITKLNSADQKLLETPLHQPSDTGRARYIGSLARQVGHRHQQAA